MQNLVFINKQSSTPNKVLFLVTNINTFSCLVRKSRIYQLVFSQLNIFVIFEITEYEK